MAKAKGKTPAKKSTKATKAAKAKPKAKKAPKPAKTAKAKPKAKPAKAKPKAKPAKVKAKAKPKAKPAAKPRAKPQPAAAPVQNGATGGVAHAELARTGNLDALFGMMDMESSSKNDRLAYKWLNVASDFGHDEAADMIGDVLEVSSLRYDDDGYETAAAHWELAAAYLEGAEGLPVDLGLARKHLEEAFRVHDLDAINAGTNEDYAAEPLLERLTGDARELLETALAGGLGARTTEAGGAGEGTEDDGGAILGGAGAAPIAEEEEEDEEEFRGGETPDDHDDDDDDDDEETDDGA